THMYSYEGNGSWKEIPITANMSSCVNESELVYDTMCDVVFFTGGLCVQSGLFDELYEWNGTDWTKVTVNSQAPRLFGAGVAYDASHQEMVMFGGFSTANTVSSTYRYKDSGWLSTSASQFDPRLLFSFTSDPDTHTVWMYGGISAAG